MVSPDDASLGQLATPDPRIRPFVRPVPGFRHLLPVRLQQRIHDADVAIRNGGPGPRIVEDTLGGTYLLRNPRGAVTAVFKPEDEEPFALNNPKGYDTPHVDERSGVRPGESALREVAAYLLDRGESFVGIPQTALVESVHPRFYRRLPVEEATAHTESDESDEEVVVRSRLPPYRLVPPDPVPVPVPASDSPPFPQTPAEPPPSFPSVFLGLPPKRGSFQEYIDSTDSAGNLCATQFPISEVHKIGIFDLRVMNKDRNDSNILVTRRNGGLVGHRRTVRAHTVDSASPLRTPDTPFSANVALVPIDHAYVLPATMVPVVLAQEWCWLSWPQSHVAFSDATLEYIMSLDADADARMLCEELPQLQRECGFVLRVGTAFLQRAAQSGRTLHEIAMAACRQDDNEPSPLETMLEEAIVEVETDAWDRDHAAAESAVLEHFGALVDEFFHATPSARLSFGGLGLNEIRVDSPVTAEAEVTPTSLATTEPQSDVSESPYLDLPASPESSPSQRTHELIAAHMDYHARSRAVIRMNAFHSKDDGVPVLARRRHDMAHSHSCHTCLVALMHTSPADF